MIRAGRLHDSNLSYVLRSRIICKVHLFPPMAAEQIRLDQLSSKTAPYYVVFSSVIRRLRHRDWNSTIGDLF